MASEMANATMKKMKIHNPLPEKLASEFAKAADILEHFIKGNNQMDAALIPEKIIAKAKGIAVITIVKAGFVWSGRAGSGLVVARLPDGRWSAPSAIAAAGAGFGAQVGAQITDCVFILNNEAAVKAFSHGGNLTLGGNMSVAAGPKGRSAEAAGAVVNFAPIYSYSKSKGLFAGVSLEGSLLITRHDANKELYGRKVKPAELLDGSVTPPVEAEPLYRVLNYRFSNMGTGVVVQVPFHKRKAEEGGEGGGIRPGSSPTGGKLGRVGVAGAGVGAGVVGGGSARPMSAAPAAAPPLYDAAGLQGKGSMTKRGPPPPVPPKAGLAASPAVVGLATALYDFAGDRETDVSFKKGDKIQVTKAGGPSEWWRGIVNGKEGDFPDRESAPFGAFGEFWVLDLEEYEQDEAGVNNAIDITLRQISGTCVEAEPRPSIFIRKELSGPDLYRRRGGWGFQYCDAGPRRTWGIGISHAEAQQLGIDDSMIVGVAIYPPATPKSSKLVVPPPPTATSISFHQAEGSEGVENLKIPILQKGHLTHLFGSSKCSDITFIVEENKIPAHANMLLTERAGPYFAGLFEHDFKEKKGKVHIDGVAHKIFKAILEYVYTGRTTVDGVVELFELYSAADRFQVTTLLPYIKHELILSVGKYALTPELLFMLIQQMKLYTDLSDVFQICVNRVLENWSAAKTSEAWRELISGPESSDWVEMFMDRALELRR
ncbi:hypothetical protein HK104_001801 [Borealophlyctis nickersoniae]|nr:hypothetical protein HK104_001801 [Borealophlyctis nickersoniae]